MTRDIDLVVALVPADATRIVRKDGPYRLAEFQRRQRITIEDFSTWIVSKEDLIISKLDWARDSRSGQQFGDIRNLLSTGCDSACIQHWTNALGLTTLWQEMQP